MNKIDFSFTGGFPLDEECLDFLQTELRDGFLAVYSDAGNVPVIISGMEYAMIPLTANFTISAGYFFYQGELFYTPGIGATHIPTLGGTAIQVNIIETALPAVLFEDGSSKNVYLQRQATIGVSAPGIGTVPYNTFKRWYQVMGESARGKALPFEQLTATLVAPGDLGITLNYRKNVMNNTLHIWGSIESQDAQNITDPPVYTALVNLPVDCRPVSSDVPFPISYNYGGGSGVMLNAAGTDAINIINALVKTTGDVQIGFIKPDAAYLGYTADFNQIIPLD